MLKVHLYYYKFLWKIKNFMDKYDYFGFYGLPENILLWPYPLTTKMVYSPECLPIKNEIADTDAAANKIGGGARGMKEREKRTSERGTFFPDWKTKLAADRRSEPDCFFS